MAQKSAKKRHVRLKPEQVLMAHEHPAVRVPKKPKPRLRQMSKKTTQLQKSGVRAARRHVPKNTLVLCVLCLGVGVWLLMLVAQMRFSQQQQMLERAGDSLTAVGQSYREQAALHGTDAQLLDEITYASNAPKELQSFVLADYRKLKQNCMVNGEYIHKPTYTIQKVVKEKFAIVARDCGGQQTAILAKSERGWAEVFTGNTSPSCSLVNDLKIPRGIATSCVYEGIEYTNPN